MTLLTRIRRSLMYARGIAGLRRDDILLVSYPKSGNTWVRFFLCNYLELAEGAGAAIGFGEVDGTMPELGVDDLRERWPWRTLPRFVKTHLAWRALFRGRRSVLVVRDPRDVMVSYFHFDRARKRPRYRGDFAGFVRHPQLGLHAWFVHTRSWLDVRPVQVRYEDLRNDDIAAFGSLFDQLGIGYELQAVREAAERSRFENVKIVERQLGHPHADERFRAGSSFAREGSSGSWTSHFAESDQALYHALRAQYADVTAALGL